MEYQSLYRKWRPDRFSTMVGQKAVIETLKNQIRSGHIGHAYLFSGTRGTGKTTSAKIFSRAINCLQPVDGEPCGICDACVALLQENNMDIIEIDAASNNGVDEIRDLRDKIKYPPQFGRYKVYIIDEVHMLSPGAFNALLKTLEEPPPHAVFILATTEPQRLPATVLSRCQRYNFSRIRVRDMAEHLDMIANSENVQADMQALELIARQADGAMRDAIGLLELCISLGQGKIDAQTVQNAVGSAGSEALSNFIEALIESDAGAALQIIDERMKGGGDVAIFSREISGYLRSLLIAFAVQDSSEILDIFPEEGTHLKEQAQKLGPERTLSALELFSRAEPEMRWASYPRSLLEMAAFRACSPAMEEDLSSLKERLEGIEHKLSTGAFTAPAADAKAEKKTKEAPAIKSEARGSIQEKSPAPAAAPPQTDGQLWQSLLKKVKAERMPLYAPLKMAQFFGIQDGVAGISFEGENSLYFTLFQKEENIAFLESTLSAVAGKAIKVRFLAANQQPAIDPSPDDNTVKQLRDLFGREHIEIVDS